MSILLSLLVFGVLLVILVKSASLLEDSLILLSKRLNVSPFITGFVLLSLASSLPEISVAVSSATQGVPDLSIGNLLGATVFLLTCMTGLFAIKHKSIPFNGSFSRSEVVIALSLFILQIVILIDQKLSLLEGIILIATYILFILHLLNHKDHTHRIHHLVPKNVTKKSTFSTIFHTAIGVALLLIAAHYIVSIGIDMANYLQVSKTFIGIIMLGIGTNLPEITILLTSNNAEKDKLAIGNFIGSAIANVPILGLLGILLPHTLEGFNALLPILVTLFITCILFSLFAWTNKRITYREGLILLFIFLALIVIEVLRYENLL